MKNVTKGEKAHLLLWLLLLLLTVVFYSRLPEEIPIHWNSLGEVDSVGGKAAAFLPMAVMAGIFVLYKYLPKIDPKKENYPRFQGAYRSLFGALSLLMAMIQFSTLYMAFSGKSLPMSIAVNVAMGLLLLFIGNQMPRLKHNYFVGIKTPWTLANEDIWWKTHRFAGRAWVLGGGIIILAAFLPQSMRGIASPGVLILIVVLPIAYSYWLFHKLTKGGASQK